MRSHYWSISKFSDWVRGTPVIPSGTSKEWREWRQTAKSAHPFRYWLAEEGIDYVEKFIFYIPDKIHNVRYYLINRFITKTNSLTAHPRDIEPGSWFDVGSRFLPCLFNELVDFVEVEKAWRRVTWNENAAKKYNASVGSLNWLKARTWRCPEAGIDYLLWESSLVFDSEWFPETDPNYAQSTPQALAAIEILKLYKWWTEERPKRLDPMDASGWTELCDQRRQRDNDDWWWSSEDDTEEEKIASRNSLDIMRNLEKQYEDEDTEMLIRLIKIREQLWT